MLNSCRWWLWKQISLRRRMFLSEWTRFATQLKHSTPSVDIGLSITIIESLPLQCSCMTPAGNVEYNTGTIPVSQVLVTVVDFFNIELLFTRIQAWNSIKPITLFSSVLLPYDGRQGIGLSTVTRHDRRSQLNSGVLEYILDSPTSIMQNTMLSVEIGIPYHALESLTFAENKGPPNCNHYCDPAVPTNCLWIMIMEPGTRSRYIKEIHHGLPFIVLYVIIDNQGPAAMFPYLALLPNVISNYVKELQHHTSVSLFKSPAASLTSCCASSSSEKRKRLSAGCRVDQCFKILPSAPSCRID
ncbi:unnamed protein product [Fusarium venenatum]|uniref:Uncharacterized protein n=1 Tax=Fusarium venenatum TaxID=56646 RepID=A0A2L2U2G6_9HYPO|nr:uncharacterized protein FVRRES_08672 [Fusarium venenatum]CEI68595.1 unnamed protein product [Fusarium venenatum]